MGLEISGWGEVYTVHCTAPYSGNNSKQDFAIEHLYMIRGKRGRAVRVATNGVGGNLVGAF